MESDDDSFAARAGFLDESIRDAPGDLAFLIGRAALQHGDLD